MNRGHCHTEVHNEQKRPTHEQAFTWSDVGAVKDDRVSGKTAPVSPSGKGIHQGVSWKHGWQK